MYDKEKQEIRRDYVGIATYGWKTWANNEPTVKLVVNSYGDSAEQNLTIEEAGQVIEMLQAAVAQALATPDHETNNDGWDEMPF